MFYEIRAVKQPSAPIHLAHRLSYRSLPKGKESMTKKELSKDARVKKELSKLEKIFEVIDKDKRIVIDGLINRAAFMRITLEDYEKDINLNGSTEPFTQSERLKPYDRERVSVRLYNAMNKNYQSIIKQLVDYLPKDLEEYDDGFEEFISR